MTENEDQKLGEELLQETFGWLADAPLFIDRDRLARMHDVVVRPVAEHGEVTISMRGERVQTMSGSIKGSAGLEFAPGAVLEMLAQYLPSLKAKAQVEAGGARSSAATEGQARTITLKPIRTPQRQLLQLALHYLGNHPGRIFYSRGTDPELDGLTKIEARVLQEVPRVLTFIDLPGYAEAHRAKVLPTMLVPMALELKSGAINLPYKELEKQGNGPAPAYPEFTGGEAPEMLLSARKEYWNWFRKNFDAHRACVAVEDAAKSSKISWIDFQLPVSADGRTLHLHLEPSARYDTGAFAYNFIKRGFENGLRIVGMLKSGPDLNVLAVYEK